MKTFGRIILAIFLGLIIIVIASAVLMSLPNVQQLLQDKPWLMAFIPHSVMLVLSTLLLLLLGKGKLDGYGYCLPQSWR